MAMTKLEIPTLTTLDAQSVSSWLNGCEDACEIWGLQNPDRTLSVAIRILAAGLKMEASVATTWWDENRDTLKALATWDLFKAQVKERFVPANWRIDALDKFYSIKQKSNTYADFVAELQAARNPLASAGVGYTINDSIFKNHLLFFANPILRLRVRALPNFNHATLKVDGLISLMASTWDSLVAEGNVRHTTSAFSSSSSTSTRVRDNKASSSTVSSSRPPELTQTERDTLKAAGGCYHCRRTPTSPGWIRHSSRDCPGDKSRGIPPRTTTSTSTAVASIIPKGLDRNELIAATMPGPGGYGSSDSEESFRVVGAIGSCVLGNGTDSEESHSDEDDD
ncbi:hypothetical protein BDN72DRAFT_906407 [Pluteus cervinus]|uniref:Uncharacterized protein n=1 Tax=Pluteus cervinus TaxID=181527 RepID=A0ACD2ZZM1_9AGAR|nr:hypothetical protein BDN72DRAFT_906407 [Pluteus cervinus]